MAKKTVKRKGKKSTGIKIKPNVLIAVLVSLVLMYAMRSVFIPLIAAWIVAYMLEPIISRISEKTGRTGAIAIVLILSCLFVTALLWFVVPGIISEAKQAITAVQDNMPQIREKLENTFDLFPNDIKRKAADKLSKASGKIVAIGGHIIQKIFTVTGAFFAAVSSTMMFVLGLFYFILDFPRLRSALLEIVHRLDSSGKGAAEFEDYLEEVNTILRSFLKGQLTVAAAIGVLTAIGLSVIGLPYAITVGLSVGILSLIPYAGIAVGIVSALVISAVAHGTVMSAILTIIVFVVVQALEGTVLTPKLVGDSVGLHPLVSVVSLIAFNELFGTIGLLLAIPLAAASLAGIRRLTGH